MRERLLEGAVELLERLRPIQLAVLDLVELALHLRGEADVEDPGKVRDEEIVDELAELGRIEALLELLDVAPCPGSSEMIDA